MCTGFTILPYAEVLPEQVLNYFDVKIDDNNKCICPFHDDTSPSMQVNESWVYCFGCKWTGDVWKLAKELLKDDSVNIWRWLYATNFPSPSGRVYRINGYQGIVNSNLIDYWHHCLLTNEPVLQQLQAARWFKQDTIEHFKLGWRPDKKAYVIPFMYHGATEIVQFRSTDTNDSGKKYWGLEGHQRGSVMNRDILDTKQEYVVVLLGALDPVLAWQDGLPAVGLNGSMPFKKEDKERVQQMFANQDLMFIVPDNNEHEFKEARKLASWLDAEVRYFPEDTPHNTDYIDYRKSGKTANDFKRDVLGILPHTDVSNHTLFQNLKSLYDVGDSLGLSGFHCHWYATGISYSDVAIGMANYVQTPQEKRLFYNVQNKEDFDKVMQLKYHLQGGW